MKNQDGSRFMSSVKTTVKGQIVIPKEVRDMFGIETGSALLLMADRHRGMIIHRLDYFSGIADAVFSGQSEVLFPQQTEDDSLLLAQAIRDVRQSNKNISDNDKYMGTVKVGPKGQIVIPKEAREMFSICPGDLLLLLADSNQGIALQRYSIFAKIADMIFSGHAPEILPNESEKASQTFAQAIRDSAAPEEAER